MENTVKPEAKKEGQDNPRSQEDKGEAKTSPRKPLFPILSSKAQLKSMTVIYTTLIFIINQKSSQSQQKHWSIMQAVVAKNRAGYFMAIRELKDIVFTLTKH